MVDDASLVQRTLAGDSSAFGELYDRYAALIRAQCFDTTRQLNTAQDLAQEVFVRAYSKLTTMRRQDQFAAWLISISRHVGQEWRRSHRRDRHRFQGSASEIPSPDESPELDDLTELRLAIAQLSELERTAIHLAYLDTTAEQSAHAALGCSRSAFYKIVTRARARLAKLMAAGKERRVP